MDRDHPLVYNTTIALADLLLIAMRRGDYASAEAVSRRLVEIRAKAVAADPADRRALAGLARARNLVPLENRNHGR